MVRRWNVVVDDLAMDLFRYRGLGKVAKLTGSGPINRRAVPGACRIVSKFPADRLVRGPACMPSGGMHGARLHPMKSPAAGAGLSIME